MNTVTVMIRARLNGKYPYLPAVWNGNGRLKPNVALVNGNEQKVEGPYYLRFTQDGRRRFKLVKGDACDGRCRRTEDGVGSQGEGSRDRRGRRDKGRTHQTRRRHRRVQGGNQRAQGEKNIRRVRLCTQPVRKGVQEDLRGRSQPWLHHGVRRAPSRKSAAPKPLSIISAMSIRF